MKKAKSTVSAIDGDSDDTRPENPPVTIRVGYEWKKDVHPAADKRWHFRTETVMGVVESVVREASKKKAAHPLSVRVSRMRALHGAMLLPSLIDRCEKSDVVMFDITEQNPNVMLELGMALAFKGPYSGRVFVFQEAGGEKDEPIHDAPSDIGGFFFTRYKANLKAKLGYSLRDYPGFRAALKTRIIEDARVRGMWKDTGGAQFEEEDGGEI